MDVNEDEKLFESMTELEEAIKKIELNKAFKIILIAIRDTK